MFQNDTAVYMALRSAALRWLLNPDQKTLDGVLALLWERPCTSRTARSRWPSATCATVQEALKEALAKGASDEELERLMKELQRA